MNNKIIFLVLFVSFCFFYGCGDDKDKNKVGHIRYWLTINKQLPLINSIKCQSENDDITMGMYNSIEGNWKLILDFGKGDTIDYSCNAVTYNFNKNGVVTIESDVVEIRGGEYNYIFNEPYIYPLTYSTPLIAASYPNLIIDGHEFYCQAAGVFLSTLFVESPADDGSPVERFDKIFYKIK